MSNLKPVKTIKNITKDATTLVYIELYYRANNNINNITVIKKQEDFAEKIGINVRTLQRTLKLLEDKNVIQITKKGNDKIIHVISEEEKNED